jgi:FkbM family methyltransferase
LTISHVNKAETEFVYREVFQDRVYLQHGIRIHDADCVFDVGANIGLFTIFLQEHFKGVKVLAFEPSPEIVPILRANTVKYTDAVTVYPCGISSMTKQELFTYYPGYTIISGFRANETWNVQTIRSGILNQWHKKYPGKDNPDERLLEVLVNGALAKKEQFVCQMRSISDVLQESGIDKIALLKIDAEGSELEVLAGIARDDWPKIRQIVMEIHDADGDRVAQTKFRLESEGFRCQFEQEDGFRESGIVNCYALRDR